MWLVQDKTLVLDKVTDEKGLKTIVDNDCIIDELITFSQWGVKKNGANIVKSSSKQ